MNNIKKNIITTKDVLYFDYAASGQAYAPIEEKIQYILKTYANTHSEVSSSAVNISKQYEQARVDLKNCLEVDDSFYLIPAGTGATAAIKKFQELLGIYVPPKTRQRYSIDPKNMPLVVVGPYEHHSNEVSFREGLCEVIRIPLNKNGTIDITYLDNILEKNSHREIIASFSVASNVTGVISDYKSIYETVKKYNGIVCLDAAAASPHMNVDCNYYDALFLSPHKLLGGVASSGILVIKKDICEDINPTFAGGGTVSYVSRISHTFLNNFEQIEDAGTPGIIQFIKASLAYKLRNEIGLEYIQEKEEELKRYFGLKISQMENVKLYCSFEQKKLSIFSLNFKHIDPYEIAKYLSDNYGIQTRAGCSCAGPYGHDLLNLEDEQDFEHKPGWLRITIHFTHTHEEIDLLLKAIKEVAGNKTMSKIL